MDNVSFFIDELGVEQAIIDHGNGEFTSMSKAEYDRRQASTLPSNSSDFSQPIGGNE
jgi:hypothetical protein